MTLPFRLTIPTLGAIALLLPAAPLLAQQRNAPKAAPAAQAAPQTGAQTFLIGTFGDWKALMSGKDKQKVCYALATPKDRKPAALKRDPAYLFVSNRLSDGAKNEIAIKLGFAGRTTEDGSLAIGAANFALVAAAESAFLKNPAQEGQIIDAMKKGQSVAIKVKSARGNETTDTYSLNGFAQALAAVAKECP